MVMLVGRSAWSAVLLAPVERAERGRAQFASIASDDASPGRRWTENASGYALGSWSRC